MRISQEDLAETEELLSKMERSAKSRKRVRWVGLASGLLSLALGVWGLVELSRADSYVANHLAAAPELTPASLSRGLEWVKYWSLQMILFLSSVITGCLILLMVVVNWRPRTSDVVFKRLVRHYLAQAEPDER